jgi:hypothetical protein
VTHLTNYTFDGARADLAKTLSQVPAFQVTHSFAAGSQGGPMGGINPGTYNFGAVYATPKVSLRRWDLRLLIGADDRVRTDLYAGNGRQRGIGDRTV